MEGFLSHNANSMTEIYAVDRFGSVAEALEEIAGEIDERSGGVDAPKTSLSGPSGVGG